MPRGKNTEVDREKLWKAVQTVEAKGPLPSLKMLQEAVATEYNDTAIDEITYSIVGLRIKEWAIPILTKPGKRGGPMTKAHKAALAKGRKMGRTSRADKFKANESVCAALNVLEKNTPERFHSLVEKVREGSMSAAVKLNCLDCSGYITAEVRLCQIKQCPMYAFRPYQGAIQEEEIEEAAIA